MILFDLGCQVGRQNLLKIDQKSHRKNDAKNKAVWDASWAVFGLLYFCRYGIARQETAGQYVDEVQPHQTEPRNDGACKQVANRNRFRREDAHVELGLLIGVG